MLEKIYGKVVTLEFQTTRKIIEEIKIRCEKAAFSLQNELERFNFTDQLNFNIRPLKKGTNYKKNFYFLNLLKKTKKPI